MRRNTATLGVRGIPTLLILRLSPLRWAEEAIA
jgi:hypothetical protein